MAAKLITANHHHGNSLLSSQVEWGKKEIVELSKPSSACSRKKEEPVDFVLMPPILPLAITVTHMSLTCQYGNYTSSRIIFFCSNASASMTFIHTLLLFITHLSTVSDLTMGSTKTNSTGFPAIFLPHSMLGSLLLLIFFCAPLLLGACSQAIMAISPLSLQVVSSSLIIELNCKHQWL